MIKALILVIALLSLDRSVPDLRHQRRLPPRSMFLELFWPKNVWLDKQLEREDKEIHRRAKQLKERGYPIFVP